MGINNRIYFQKLVNSIHVILFCKYKTIAYDGFKNVLEKFKN